MIVGPSPLHVEWNEILLEGEGGVSEVDSIRLEKRRFWRMFTTVEGYAVSSRCEIEGNGLEFGSTAMPISSCVCNNLN
ncbi:hypothetical protein MLD38_014701 [Melastoma candidum]|uniref:Uncharacterized protein n=1 Tax=Melastoma candidum TaxID=119954 RepID=A0ACB9RM34_9MYRT|nr:hypothetical protein MLD38_014701 [Melastoma candidum]